jgi:hypothetical protein
MIPHNAGRLFRSWGHDILAKSPRNASVSGMLFNACVMDDQWDLPESQTTTVPEALSCSREVDMMCRIGYFMQGGRLQDWIQEEMKERREVAMGKVFREAPPGAEAAGNPRGTSV